MSTVSALGVLGCGAVACLFAISAVALIVILVRRDRRGTNQT
jgi:hypothetical protein